MTPTRVSGKRPLLKGSCPLKALDQGGQNSFKFNLKKHETALKFKAMTSVRYVRCNREGHASQRLGPLKEAGALAKEHTWRMNSSIMIQREIYRLSWSVRVLSFVNLRES